MQDPLIGRVLGGRYEVVRHLGQGGMGALYVAMQRPLGRQVALKVLLRRHLTDPEAVRRFEKEAHAVSRLHHPHIVTLFDFGATQDGELYIAMELLQGEDLRTLLQRERRMAWKRSLHVVKGIATALVEAHRHRVIHRDLKPENVMLVDTTGDPDYVKVLDFGLARTFEDVPGRQVTSQNVIAGTPSYLSPERINGVGDDPRSDLYAIGAMWFELLTGRIPFEGDSAIQILVGHMQSPVPTVTGLARDVPAPIDELVRSLLAKEPGDRPQSASELLQRLNMLDAPDQWQALPSHRFQAQTSAVPEVSLKDEGDLDDMRFEAAVGLSLDDELEREEEPIPLTKVKHRPQFEVPRLAVEDMPQDLLEQKPTSQPAVPPPARRDPPLAFRPRVVTSISEAATLLGSAKDLAEVAQACAAFLASRFDRAVVFDLRGTPRTLASSNLLGKDDAAYLLSGAAGLLRLAGSGQIAYGPAHTAEGWEDFHRRLSGRTPGGALIAALSAEGHPALLIYADHDRAELFADLRDVTRLLREAAAALSLLAN